MSTSELSRPTPAATGASSPAHHSTGVIGIVGGVGPFAGLDLQRKILEQTVAGRDQEHLPVLAVSWPGAIPDRTEFLLGRVAENPARAIVAQLRLLAGAGATVAAVPCNTAHAPAIFDAVRAEVARFARPLRLLHMIDETAAHLAAHHPDVRCVGVLSTTGAWQTRIYPNALEPLGYRVIVPDETMQTEWVHPATYDPEYGIKATGTPTAQARANLVWAVAELHARGAEAVILGCTELPLALPERVLDGVVLVDPTLALARALVREVGRVKEWDVGQTF